MRITNTFWNHNSVYYHWINRQITPQATILDVGCGDGTLARILQNGRRTIAAIDTDGKSIERANAITTEDLKIQYLQSAFEDYDSKEETLDAVIFVASLHHMDMETAVRKAKRILRPNGKLIVVGLASPSSVADWCIEVLRVIPCRISSLIHKEKQSEELGIKTSYTMPKMAEVRKVVRDALPGAKLRQGLYYRYLLTWIKR